MNQTKDNNSILVFATNIDDKDKANLVYHALKKLTGIIDIWVDLEDNDNILRIECVCDIMVLVIQSEISKLGFKCVELL